MGNTNLLTGLKTKFAALAGEAQALNRQADKIEIEVARVGDIRARANDLEVGAEHALALIKMIEPDFDAASVKPRKPHGRVVPFKPGECTKAALDVLRLATEPMTAREVAKEVLARRGEFKVDSHIEQRITNSIDASFRSHEGKITKADHGYPRRRSVKGVSG